MIVLADNDILIKLAGCNLLREFFDLLKADTDDIFITNRARHSIPKKAKKKISDDFIKEELSKFIEKLQILPPVDNAILEQLQKIEGIDYGEAYLMLSVYNYPDANLITADKNFLNALIENKDIAPITEIVDMLKGRVYSLESSLLYLIDIYGFEYVSERVINRCTDDITLKIGFDNNRTKEYAIQCLSSECRKILPLLTNINLYKELE